MSPRTDYGHRSGIVPEKKVSPGRSASGADDRFPSPSLAIAHVRASLQARTHRAVVRSGKRVRSTEADSEEPEAGLMRVLRSHFDPNIMFRWGGPRRRPVGSSSPWLTTPRSPIACSSRVERVRSSAITGSCDCIDFTRLAKCTGCADCVNRN